MPEKTTRSGVGEAWLAQRASPWHLSVLVSLGMAHRGGTIRFSLRRLAVRMPRVRHAWVPRWTQTPLYRVRAHPTARRSTDTKPRTLARVVMAGGGRSWHVDNDMLQSGLIILLPLGGELVVPIGGLDDQAVSEVRVEVSTQRAAIAG
jgi:hypothetical protein